MSLHSVYNIVALTAFALGAAALITAAILFVSQRLWEVISDRRKRPAPASRNGTRAAKVHTPPQPAGGWSTSVLDRSVNAADGTRLMNGQANVAPGTTVLDRSANAANGARPMNGCADAAPGTRPMNDPANAANSTTLLNSQADVAAGTTMLKTTPVAPPSASGGTVQLKPPTASGGTTMRRVTPGASATRVLRAQDAVSAHVLGAYAASTRPNRSEPPAAFRIVKDEVVVHTSEVI